MSCSTWRDQGMYQQSQPSESGGAGDNNKNNIVDCTGRSCAAVSVASCVALGCCPCAAVSILLLTLVKAPWALSRRVLTLLKKRMKRGRSSSWRRRVGDEGGGTEKVEGGDDQVDIVVAKNKSLEVILGMEETGRSLCSMHEEAEKMWMEWYQLGHWGFGRVSFSGSLSEGVTQGRSRSSGASQNAPAIFADE